MKRFILSLLVLLIASPAFGQANVYRPITNHAFAFTTTATSDVNRPLQPFTRVARVICNATCHVAFPVTPVVTAATVPIMLAPLQAEYFRVSPGTVVLVKGDTTTGIVSVTEMNAD